MKAKTINLTTKPIQLFKMQSISWTNSKQSSHTQKYIYIIVKAKLTNRKSDCSEFLSNQICIFIFSFILFVFFFVFSPNKYALKHFELYISAQVNDDHYLHIDSVQLALIGLYDGYIFNEWLCSWVKRSQPHTHTQFVSRTIFVVFVDKAIWFTKRFTLENINRRGFSLNILPTCRSFCNIWNSLFLFALNKADLNRTKHANQRMREIWTDDWCGI